MKYPVTDLEVFVRLLLFNNRELKSENSLLESELSNLSLELANLRMQLSALESPSKNSCNSSIPPSQDDLQSQSLRRTKTLREKSDRSTGGQKGHKGTTLAFNEDADITINHPAPEVCSHCGGSLHEIAAKVLETRQSIDILENLLSFANWIKSKNGPPICYTYFEKVSISERVLR